MLPLILPRYSNLKLVIWYYTLTVMYHTSINHGHEAALEGTNNLDIYHLTLHNQNLPPPTNGPIQTECRIMRHVVAYAAESEVGRILHNGKTAAPLQINLKEICFTQLPIPIKKYDSAAEGIITATVGQKRSKAMDMIFFG